MKYPAYQCFKTIERDVYCSSYEVKNHDVGAEWVAKALQHFGLKPSEILSKPYISNDIPSNATQYP